MKKKVLFITILLIGLLLCGCGNGQGTASAPGTGSESVQLPETILNSTGGEEAYDVQVKEERLSPYLEKGEFIMGAQYEGEEPLFWVGMIQETYTLTD